MILPAEKLLFGRRVNRGKERQNIMGDKSPKANQKKSGQKQSKATAVSAKKSAVVAAKQSAGKKK
jgi:hypothetical protein